MPNILTYYIILLFSSPGFLHAGPSRWNSPIPSTIYRINNNNNKTAGNTANVGTLNGPIAFTAFKFNLKIHLFSAAASVSGPFTFYITIVPRFNLTGGVR